MRSLFASMAAVALFAAPVAAQPAPNPANDPNACRDLWKDVGLPQYARPVEHNATIVCHTRYVLSHNNQTKTPDWVFEQLDKSQFEKKISRPDIGFSTEKNVAKGKAARDEDYTNSKLDRGHQAPSADFASKVEWMNESFILSNAVPQQGIGFNRHIWKDFEDLVRNIAEHRGRVYVITGPIHRDADGKVPAITKRFNRCGKEIQLRGPDNRLEICEAKNKNPSAACDAGVAVPVGLFKIVYDPKRPLVNAYVLPNINHTEAGETPTPIDYLKQFQVTVHTVERLTGLEFFRDLPKTKRDQLNLRCGQAVVR